MPKQFSIYMNMLRFFAAFVVVISHLDDESLTGSTLIWLRGGIGYGHHAVIIFFVLSGYFVAQSAERSASFRDYSIARLSRIYSVVLPMIAIVPVLDLIGQSAEPSLYNDNLLPTVVDFLLSLTLSNMYWFLDRQYFSNEPYWSISYEVAYYALFGLWCFSGGLRSRLLTVALSFVVGPVIMLLFPCWLAGVLLWRYRERLLVGPRTAVGLFFGSIAVYAACGAGEVFAAMNWGSELAWRALGLADLPWKASRNWATDYLITIMVLAHLIGAVSLARLHRLRVDALGSPAQWLADGSFALYLFHVPLLLMFGALVGDFRSTSAGMVLILTLSVVSAYALAEISDRRRREWLAATKRLANWLSVRTRH